MGFAKKCEEAGFEGMGLNEALMFSEDTYLAMAMVLANTNRLKVHPAVTCTWTAARS